MSKRLLSLLILTLSVLFVGCSKKSTDSQNGSLEGIATREGQEDHGGILVQLRESNLQTTTATDGWYSFSSVPAGTYSILATDGDTTRQIFDFAIQDGISVTNGRQTVAPNMELPLFHRIESDINGQVRWTPDEGPYLIAQSVALSSGARLNIEPGTIVKFADYCRLTIWGEIIAKGTASDSILFTSAKVEGNPSDWDRISIHGLSTDPEDTLTYCQIQYANIGLACHQAPTVILRNSISGCFGYAIVSVSSAPQIKGNLLSGNYGGISCESGANAIIEANVIRENTAAGIECTANSSPRIADNIVSQNMYGLWTESECSPLVWHNQFSANEDALSLHNGSDALIEANEIFDQRRYGVYLSGPNHPQIHRNNIFQNDGYAIYLAYRDDLEAQNNWWGTDDLNEIGTFILDVHDNAELGEVLLDPILGAPVDSAGPRTLP